jgi:hypothetical protein
MRKAPLLVLLFGLLVSSRTEARAPDTFEEHYAEPIVIDTPMWFAFELKLGPFRPNNSYLRDAFGSDRGWLLSTELDVTAYHIPYTGQLNVGFGWGWANYDAKAKTLSGANSGESTSFTIYPMSLMAVVRIDALARMTVVPVTFAGKLGFDVVRWKGETGSTNDGQGWNKGLRWGAQAAFELDILDRKSARRLDDDFGINHTFLMFEYFGSMTKGTGGNSFQLGLGLQF